jgi:signal transduction histidine kinase
VATNEQQPDKAGFENLKTSLQQTYETLFVNIDSAEKMMQALAPHMVAAHSDYENNARYRNLLGTIQWFRGNYDSAIVLYRLALDYANQHHCEKQQTNITSNMGALFNLMSQPDSSRVYLMHTLQLALQLGDSNIAAKAYFDLGNLYNKTNYLHLSLENLQLAADYYARQSDSVKLAMAYSALGITWQQIGDFQKSIHYIRLAILYNRSPNTMMSLMDLYNNMGVTWWLTGGNYDSARYYVNKALALALRQQKPDIKYTCYINLGGIEGSAGNYTRSLKYLRMAQNMSYLNDNEYRKAALFINIGYAFKSIGQVDSAYRYVRRGLTLARRQNANINTRNAYRVLYQLDSITGNMSAALANYRKYRDFSDTVSNTEVRNKIAELEIQHQTAERKKENELLKLQRELDQHIISKQRLTVWVVVASLLIIVFCMLLLVRNRKKLSVAYATLKITNEALHQQRQQIELQNINLEQQKKELILLNQTKDKFFSIIAHDLRSPFSALVNFLDMLVNDFHQTPDDEKLDILRLLQASSENTYQQLSNLLDWSRSQRGLITSKPECISPRQITHDTLELLKSRLLRKQHSVINSIPPDMHCYADIMLLQNVMTNLINNAIKFTPRGGRINIAAEEAVDNVHLIVADNGIGIPPELLSDLFSITSRNHREGTESEMGTGLGLNMCQEYVKLMKGSIRVESREGLGTRFTVSLPQCEPKPENELNNE